MAVRALAGAGSLFAGVTDCYGGGGAAMAGTATCGGGTNAADGTPIIPANTGGGASAHRGMIVSLTPMGTTASERRALNKAAFDQAKASATGGNGVVRGQAASDPLPGSSGLIRVRYALPNTTTVHVQIDRYTWRSASTARRVAALDDDGLLKYREDRFMWGRSRWQTVTVQVPANYTQAQLVAAVNAKSTLGRITSTVRIGTLPSRGTVLTAWKLGAGATPAKPWGRAPTSARCTSVRAAEDAHRAATPATAWPPRWPGAPAPGRPRAGRPAGSPRRSRA